VYGQGDAARARLPTIHPRVHQSRITTICPSGAWLSRREVLSLLGAAGALLVLGCSIDGEAATTPPPRDQ
jgi:hypothetical protein